MNVTAHPTRPSIRHEDKHAGKQIKQRRMVLGLTQSNVADALGISFQQLQKYETGANRVSFSKICDLAKILRCRPSYFFEGIGEEHNLQAPLDNEEMQMLTCMRFLSENQRHSLLEVAKRIKAANSERKC